ncbi:MAG: type I restriction enzyme HsdR N-terminal domain-containing protein [Bacteroidia bacterium]
MQPLTLQNYTPKLQKIGFRTEIFCPLRKKWYKHTPEESVRQRFVHFLITECGYAKNLIALEYDLTIEGKGRRADIAVFNREGAVTLIVECKKNEISLSQAVFDQLTIYHSKVKCEYIVVTNGLYYDIRKFDKALNYFIVTDELPK